MKKRTVLQTRLSSLNGCSMQTNQKSTASLFDVAIKGLGVSDKSLTKNKSKSRRKKLEEA